jgi:PAS domain S-box-containing protein
MFAILSEEGYTEVQQALIETYHSQATADRSELTESIFSEIITVLQEQVDTATQVEVLTTAIERLLNRFTAVVEAAPVAIIVTDADGGIQLWNDGAERIFGWNDAEIRQRAYPHALTESSETTERLLACLRDGEQLHGIEAQHTHKSGGIRDVRIWAAPIQTQGETAQTQGETAQTQGETTQTQAEGFSGGVFIVSDISEQKQREQRLAVLNRVLRHNIRTDVNVIQGHLEMLAESHAEDNEHVQIMNKRLSNIVQLSNTARNIEQLRDNGEAERTTLDLGSMLRERVERLRAESSTAHISVNLPESLPVVADDLLPHAFDNVLDNAIEHNNSEDPRIEIEAAARPNPSSKYVTVTVADNGPGLPAVEREVLTSETETPLKHSEGLGLWLTRWIVKSSGGTITVRESDLGGTCIAVRLRTQSR